MRVEPAPDRGAARLVLARPLRHQRREGARAVPHVAAAPHAPAARDRQLRRPAARDGEGPRDAPVPRRHHQRRRASATRTSGASASSCSPWAATAATPRTTWSPRRARSPAGWSTSPAGRTRRAQRSAPRRGARCSSRAVTTPATKTLLGTTGAARPRRRARRDPRAPGDRAGSSPRKLYRELVGLEPDDADRRPRSATTFRARLRRSCRSSRRSSHDAAFTSDARGRAPSTARRSRSSSASCRRPARRSTSAVGPTADGAGARRRRGAAHDRLRAVRAAQRRRVPEGAAPPRARTSSCTRSTCCRRSRRAAVPAKSVDDLLRALRRLRRERRTRATCVDAERDPGRRLALVAASPEYTVV